MGCPRPGDPDVDVGFAGVRCDAGLGSGPDDGGVATGAGFAGVRCDGAELGSWAGGRGVRMKGALSGTTSVAVADTRVGIGVDVIVRVGVILGVGSAGASEPPSERHVSETADSTPWTTLLTGYKVSSAGKSICPIPYIIPQARMSIANAALAKD